jgi:hypothetical protein
MKSTLGIGLGLTALLAALGTACSPAYGGVPGSASVSAPAIKGTVFTIIFENHDEASVVNPKVPYIWQLAQDNSKAAAYITSIHPSLPNYIVMTSGDKKGIGNDNDPLQSIKIPGQDNVMAQLDTAGIPWRAYMESMGQSCRMESDALYSAHHNPFLYYDHVTNDPAYCAEHDVDMSNLDADLAADKFKFVWITPNMCNDMHDCPAETTDAWLQALIPKLQASPGYQNDGAIFIMFDEGSTRILGAGADLPTIVLSPRLVSKGFVSNTRYDHRSYVATMEDIFKMPRLPTTVDAVPMSEFFQGNAL